MGTPTTYPITIEQQDSDFSQRITISKLIGKILHIAGADANSKGFGVETLNKESRSWVLSRFALEVETLPKVGETIEAQTWISECNRLLSTRNFILLDSQSRKIGEAATQWCMIDLATRKAVDLTTLPAEHHEHIIGVGDATIIPPSRIASPQSTSEHTHRVGYSDLDFNHHLNSLRYIDLMVDILPLESLVKPRPFRIETQYLQECKHGDTLTIKHQAEEEYSLFEITKNGDASAAKCKFFFN